MNKGQYYEEQAVEYLQRAGLSVVERNFRCKLGEIDIICRQGEQLIFVEVRYRSNPGFGSPAASVNRGKQRKIIRTAQFYLQNRRQFRNKFCRFDVLALTPARSCEEVDVQWLKNAFVA
jgi:putative endonuclease